MKIIKTIIFGIISIIVIPLMVIGFILVIGILLGAFILTVPFIMAAVIFAVLTGKVEIKDGEIKSKGAAGSE